MFLGGLEILVNIGKKWVKQILRLTNFLRSPENRHFLKLIFRLLILSFFPVDHSFEVSEAKTESVFFLIAIFHVWYNYQVWRRKSYKLYGESKLHQNKEWSKLDLRKWAGLSKICIQYTNLEHNFFFYFFLQISLAFWIQN